jgi:hypothetical protein
VTTLAVGSKAPPFKLPRDGGGSVVVDSVQEVYNPIHMATARPYLAYNVITKSDRSPWFDDKPLLEFLETVEVDHKMATKPFRFGVQLLSGPFQRLNQDAGSYVAFEGHVIRRLPGKVFGECRLVTEDHRRVSIDRRHHLGHDDPLRVLLA